jgi:hypothetical protein
MDNHKHAVLLATHLCIRVWFKHRSNHFMPAFAQGWAMALAQVRWL